MEFSRRFVLLKDVLLKAGTPKYRLEQLTRQLYAGKTTVSDLKALGTQAKNAIETHFGPDLLTLRWALFWSWVLSSVFVFAPCRKVGLKRQLSVDEISDQVLYFQANGIRADSISFMGMGEPLANPRVFETLKLLTDPRAFGISARRLNISTSGVLPGIKKLNEQHPQVPANRMYPFPEVFTLLDERIGLTGRRVWIAYLLLQGVNDSVEHAKALAALIRSRQREIRHLYHVSLIEYNDGKGVSMSLQRSDDRHLRLFEDVLDNAHISHSRRNYFGREIDAACGQQCAAYDPEPKRIESACSVQLRGAPCEAREAPQMP
ncbi:GPI transamidase 8, putative [Eimeria tenella]|uniref:GPI transamidase 8, putative n=1 Tax=Eimeria tenella TaxID=5802 RepID=U6KNE3_EIMTE|nr:GPI transamidase 8, putative [Eimeria tenella]CDJ39491.1 GPI transamidase 8, putative [Eimeria tenella]|eukprot:XP_013230246.1 GPI transamidase 8, putative [Eimeria tenella]